MYNISVLTTEYCARKVNAQLFRQTVTVAGIDGLKREMSFSQCDAVMLCRCEKGAEGIAVSIASTTPVILMGDFTPDERDEMSVAGVVAVAPEELEKALTVIYAMRVHLKALEFQANDLQRKLDDTRIVNRAKLLLMSRLKMSEKEAHRYIEKAAMDGCLKKRDVAESILRTYEE